MVIDAMKIIYHNYDVLYGILVTMEHPYKLYI